VADGHTKTIDPVPFVPEKKNNVICYTLNTHIYHIKNKGNGSKNQLY